MNRDRTSGRREEALRQEVYGEGFEAGRAEALAWFQRYGHRDGKTNGGGTSMSDLSEDLKNEAVAESIKRASASGKTVSSRDATQSLLWKAALQIDRLEETLAWVRKNYASGSTAEINARIDAALGRQ